MLDKIKRFLLTSFLMCPLIFFISTSSYAAEATKTINLWQGYNEVEFTLSFDDEYETHTIKITSPNGEVTERETSGYDSCKIKLNNCPAGDYTVKITTEDVDGPNEGIMVTIETSCYGPVVSTEGTDLYNISSKISGLKFFFVDGELNVVWDVENVSSLNLKVTNPETMQVLADKTVKGGSYSLPLSEYIDEIEVYAVASSEAKIDGAGEKRTLKPVREVPGFITFPSMEITNRNDYTFTLENTEEVSIEVYDNDTLSYSNTYDPGKHDVTTALSGINNTITVYVEDENGNKKSYSSYIIKDTIAPTLTLTEKLDGVTTTKETINVVGYVTNGAEKLLLNDYEVDFEEETGRFSESIPLKLGTNNIVLCVLDSADNESTIMSVVTRVEETPKSPIMGYLKLGGIVLIIVAVVVAIVLKSRSLKKKEAEKKEAERRAQEEKERKEAKAKKPVKKSKSLQSAAAENGRKGKRS